MAAGRKMQVSSILQTSSYHVERLGDDQLYIGLHSFIPGRMQIGASGTGPVVGPGGKERRRDSPLEGPSGPLLPLATVGGRWQTAGLQLGNPLRRHPDAPPTHLPGPCYPQAVGDPGKINNTGTSAPSTSRRTQLAHPMRIYTISRRPEAKPLERVAKFQPSSTDERPGTHYRSVLTLTLRRP